MESTNEIKDLFRPTFDAVRETIIEEGYHWDINWSSIQSKLIYLAGRYCDRFASDLNIDIFAIIRHIEQRTLQSGMHLFGFREDGVDHSSLVEALSGGPYNRTMEGKAGHGERDGSE